MHTPADVQLDGNRATLKQASTGRAPAVLVATIVSPAGAKFELLPCNPSPPQAQQPNVKKLAVVLEGVNGPTRIAVLFAAPSADGRAMPIELQPLDRWAPTR